MSASILFAKIYGIKRKFTTVIGIIVTFVQYNPVACFAQRESLTNQAIVEI